MGKETSKRLEQSFGGVMKCKLKAMETWNVLSNEYIFNLGSFLLSLLTQDELLPNEEPHFERDLNL